jgi:hypothetical protein
MRVRERCATLASDSSVCRWQTGDDAKLRHDLEVRETVLRVLRYNVEPEHGIGLLESEQASTIFFAGDKKLL